MQNFPPLALNRRSLGVEESRKKNRNRMTNTGKKKKQKKTNLKRIEVLRSERVVLKLQMSGGQTAAKTHEGSFKTMVLQEMSRRIEV